MFKRIFFLLFASEFSQRNFFCEEEIRHIFYLSAVHSSAYGRVCGSSYFSFVLASFVGCLLRTLTITPLSCFRIRVEKKEEKEGESV